MKIRIATEGRTITVDMEQGMAQKMFNDFASVLLGIGIRNESESKSNDVRPLEKMSEMMLLDAGAQEPEEGYRGFLYIKCRECGEIKGFCAKHNLTESRCKCGAITPLADLHRMYVNCQCGNQAKYNTNMEMDMFDVDCIKCGSPVAVSWNAKKMIYQTIQ